MIRALTLKVTTSTATMAGDGATSHNTAMKPLSMIDATDIGTLASLEGVKCVMFCLDACDWQQWLGKSV